MAILETCVMLKATCLPFNLTVTVSLQFLTHTKSGFNGDPIRKRNEMVKFYAFFQEKVGKRSTE